MMNANAKKNSGRLGHVLAWVLPLVLLFAGLPAAEAAVVAHWKFDGSLNDETTSHNATVLGGAPSYGAGQYGSALVLNGSSDYLTTNSDSDGLSMGGAFTAMGWIYSNDLGGDKTIFGKDGGGNNNQLHLITRGGKAHLGFYGNDTGGNQALSTGTWTHLAWSYDTTGGVQSIFVNGLPDASNGGRAALGNGGGNVLIGRWGGGNYFNGLLDDLVIVDQALATNQVQHVMNGGNPANLPPPPCPPLVSHYAFDGNTNDGGTLANAAGTLVGNATFAPGRLGQALSLDGSGDYFDTNQDAPYDFQNGHVSFSAWVKLDADDWNDTWEAILAKGEGNTWRFAREGNNNDRLSYGNSWNQQTADLRDNEWHHIAIIHTSGVGNEFFFDGVSLGTGGGSLSDDRASDLWIGANSQAGGREFGGLIDDVAIWGGTSGTDIGPDWAKAIYTLAVDPDHQYDAGQVNLLGQMHWQGSGSVLIGRSLWHYAASDPGDGRTFVQFGSDGSGVVETMVPEPATMALLGLAAVGLGGYVRRRRQAA